MVTPVKADTSVIASNDSSGAQVNSCSISRRAFVGAAAALGATVSLSAGGWDFAHPQAAFANDAPVELKHSYCDMCNHVPKCGIVAHVKEGKVVRIESREKYPTTPLCAKGIASLQELYDPHRLLQPQVRTNAKGTGASEWKTITWDEAYATIAEKLNAVKAQHGADSVLFFCGDPKEPRGAMQRLATLFGSSSYGSESSVCAAASWMCAQMVFGQNSMGENPGDKTTSCLIWSLNAAWSQPSHHPHGNQLGRHPPASTPRLRWRFGGRFYQPINRAGFD